MKYLLLMVMMSLAACTLNVPGQVEKDYQVKDGDKANLFIFRDKQGVLLHNAYYHIYVDDYYVGKLSSNSLFSLKLPPGKHTVWVNDKEKSQISVLVEEGRTYYVRGFYRGRPEGGMRLEQVESLSSI